MKRIFTGKWIVLGIVFVALVVFATVFFAPVVNREPGILKHMHEMPAIIVAVQAYYSEYISLPNGTTEEILKALQGDNTRQIVFLEPHEVPMKDTWKTPYRVTIDEGSIIAASAGPDREWGTSDDIIQEKSIEP